MSLIFNPTKEQWVFMTSLAVNPWSNIPEGGADRDGFDCTVILICLCGYSERAAASPKSKETFA